MELNFDMQKISMAAVSKSVLTKFLLAIIIWN